MNIRTIEKMGACSSAWLERTAHNGLVAGSNPAGPTIFGNTPSCAQIADVTLLNI